MPAEKRNLRSNKTDSSASADGKKTRSDSSSSNTAKEKPTHSRSTSSRSKSISKKASTGSGKEMSGDKKKAPEGQPVENGVNGADESESNPEQSQPSTLPKDGKDRDGDDEMTVVVPPSKGANGDHNEAKPEDMDTKVDDAPKEEDALPEEVPVDPKEKAAQDIKSNFSLLERGVVQFDPRFSLRVLRTISSTRKHMSSDVLAKVIIDTYLPQSPSAISLLKALHQDPDFPENDVQEWRNKSDGQHSSSKAQASKDVLPEIDVYLSILVQIHLYDQKSTKLGAEFSTALVEHLRALNRRTLDPLAARVYFYYSLFHEELEPLPPSPIATVISIRKTLLDALRTATLRKDQDVQSAVTTLLLRNYLSTSHIQQADLLISHAKFPQTAANNQIARYMYYLGRTRAIQLRYTDAHDHLTSATRKAPTSFKAAGFYQSSTKLLIVVELLMGDIPDRAVFRQPSLEQALQPYLQLVQAVSAGDVAGFQSLTQRYNANFRRDDTYTLILRLRQNVIKTGIRMMSLSYARISLRDMCLRLGLESEESAEYIVAKAIRDGVIEASLDHEKGYMKSKDVGDVYTTREPGDAFHERIQACLALHDESVKAMRFPMNQHRLELKHAQEARERERELAKEIVDGELDDEDGPGGDFEGI